MTDYDDFDDGVGTVAPSLEDFDVPTDAPPKPRELSKQPLFQTLFAEVVEPDDAVLADFAAYVAGPLSEHFAVSAAKGGAFFCEKEAAGAPNTQRYSRDQSLRAHLINGMLPARRVAQLLKAWGAPKLRPWNETTERLFVAGYMLHDFTKILGVKDGLKAAGFKEMEAPSDRQIPTLELIFAEWCSRLGLDAFLQPVGGVETHLHNLIFIACNTQRYNGTVQASGLLPNVDPDVNVYEVATDVSRLADLIAYIARTPRDVVSDNTISKLLRSLSFNRQTGDSYARFVYHHVAENRGVLLNLIHNATLEALRNDGRVPLLFAPSGVVYLERYNAPPMPSPDELIPKIVMEIRQKTAEGMAERRKGAKLSKDGLRTDDSYLDLFDLRSFVRAVPRLTLLVRGNAPQYLQKLQDMAYPHSDDLPRYSKDKQDARLRQLAEWASLLEIHYEARLPALAQSFRDHVIERWGLNERKTQFETLRTYKPERAEGTGIRYHWYWAAAHALDRRPKEPQATLDWIAEISDELADALPHHLPASAQADETKWRDLADYLSRVLTLGGAKTAQPAARDELARYTNAKGKRGGAVCAVCGEAYTTSKPKETAVAFQPGVYTARVKLDASSNTRSLCSLCALEQLLRQLFMFNLDSGSAVEGQRVRYLSFYPTYFFTPETMRLMQRVYMRLKDLRLSESTLRRAISDTNLSDTVFWQRLEEFLLLPSGAEPSKRVLRYAPEAQATIFMAGFREFRDPTDTEAWILPALFALVLPICLDVKVVASESSTPLLLEADELPETVWLEGAHSAIADLLQDSHLRIDYPEAKTAEFQRGLMPALTRLAAAYMIHLDTEYVPPKENFHRFAPIAHALMESPLYVFHYLKKQMRDDHPVSAERVQRYIAYAEFIFSPKGDHTVSLARKLVEDYRGFYRAKTPLNGNRMRRPLDVVAETLLKADPRLFDTSEALTELAEAELKRFMARVGEGKADGRFPKGISAPERAQAIRQFSQTFVDEVFIGIFNRDVAALRGKQLNLLSSACESLYETMQRAEWAERGRDDEDDDVAITDFTQ